jgi:hypothetical protein
MIRRSKTYNPKTPLAASDHGRIKLNNNLPIASLQKRSDKSKNPDVGHALTDFTEGVAV